MADSWRLRDGPKFAKEDSLGCVQDTTAMAFEPGDFVRCSGYVDVSTWDDKETGRVIVQVGFAMETLTRIYNKEQLEVRP